MHIIICIFDIFYQYQYYLLQDEMEAKQRKAREQHERDNPKMCKPTEPIPMPYKDNPDDNKIETYHG